MQLLTINEAAELASKSIQTMRRMIKQKKIQVKRQKTPQGFNYLIIKESLLDFMNKQTMDSQIMEEREHRPITSSYEELTATIQKLIEQHAKDKENFFGLIKTFQERNTVLEEKVKLLEAPKPSRWKFWK